MLRTCLQGVSLNGIERLALEDRWWGTTEQDYKQGRRGFEDRERRRATQQTTRTQRASVGSRRQTGGRTAETFQNQHLAQGVWGGRLEGFREMCGGSPLRAPKRAP